MKRVLSLLMLSTAIIGIGKVNAESNKEIYYTNQNGISLTEKEYNYVKTMFDEHYIEIMNQEDYDLIDRLHVNENEVEITVKEPDYIQTRGTFVETQAKRLAISKSCSGNMCIIAMTNTWKYEPKVKSYDVIGSLFSNTRLYDDGVATVWKIDGTNYRCTEYVTASNGIGCSYKLNSSASEEIYTYMTFDVYTGGLVYGSYQHAGSTVTLSQSKNYRFDINGYGNVFIFNTTRAKNAYDGMDGVTIYV